MLYKLAKINLFCVDCNATIVSTLRVRNNSRADHTHALLTHSHTCTGLDAFLPQFEITGHWKCDLFTSILIPSEFIVEIDHELWEETLTRISALRVLNLKLPETDQQNSSKCFTIM